AGDDPMELCLADRRQSGRGRHPERPRETHREPTALQLRRTTMATLTLPVRKEDHSRGAADAVVTLVEYGDFECPYCGQAHMVLQELMEEMGPQLTLVFRHFPLT